MRTTRFACVTAACILAMGAGPPAAQAIRAKKQMASRPELQTAPPPPVVPDRLGASYYLYCKAEYAALHRQYDVARDFLLQAIQVDPNASDLHLELARMSAQLQDIDSALEQSQLAASLAPDALEPKRLTVDLYSMIISNKTELDDATFNKAVAAFLDLLRADPSDEHVRMRLGDLYYEQGNFGQAAEILKPFVAAHPDNEDGVHLLSEALLRSGQIDQAEKTLRTALAANPANPDLGRLLAEVLQAKGDTGGSLAMLKSLVKQNPRAVALRFDLVRSYLAAERFDDAAREAGDLVQGLSGAAPGSTQEEALRASRILLIDALTQAGSIDKALDEVAKAEQRFKNDDGFALKQAELLFIRGKDKDAGALLKELGRKDGGPDRSARSAVLVRAGAYEEQHGKFDRAVKLLQQALDLDSGNAVALNYLGYMLADKNVQLDRALDLILKAVHLDSENGAYLDSLGWVYFRLGKYSEAQEALEHAARVIADEPVVHDHLGELYMAQKKPGEAVKAWEEAIRLGAKDASSIQKKLKKARAAASSSR